MRVLQVSIVEQAEKQLIEFQQLGPCVRSQLDSTIGDN